MESGRNTNEQIFPTVFAHDGNNLVSESGNTGVALSERSEPLFNTLSEAQYICSKFSKTGDEITTSERKMQTASGHQTEILENCANGRAIFRTSSSPVSQRKAEGNESNIGQCEANADERNTERSLSRNTLRSQRERKEKSDSCLRHGKENQLIFPENETQILCHSCSKSMLSYIVLMQQFLENVARNVCRQADSFPQCPECVKEGDGLTSLLPSAASAPYEEAPAVLQHRVRDGKVDLSLKTNDVKINITDETVGTSHDKRFSSSKKAVETFYCTACEEDFSKSEGETSGIDNSNSLEWKENYSKTGKLISIPQFQNNVQEHKCDQSASKTALSDHQIQLEIATTSAALHQSLQWGAEKHKSKFQNFHDNIEKSISACPGNYDETFENTKQVVFNRQVEISVHRHNSDSQTTDDLRGEFYVTPDMTNQMQLSSGVIDNSQAESNFRIMLLSKFPHSDGVDGILSTLYKEEQGLQDVSKETTAWQRLADSKNKRLDQNLGRITKEAFVTIARNNVDALGCLVLGASLLLCRTSRTLCVLVSDEVSSSFMAPLSSVFQDVQLIRSLESLGTTKLSLLDQPQLGISFCKFNVWRLEQFEKCIFLNPDTLVIQNCDELFCYEELSAVPDIGWPDCFNSAVFVFKPSTHTFWQLLEFAEKQGSYDGGDLGLLNTFFDSWVQDTHKKLSFIYNLMANVSYTYTPAFKQFGRNVKIVQFMGSFKPWHVKFYSSSGHIAPSSSVHPTYVQFVYVWLTIFRTSILPLFSQEVQMFALSENITSIYELLRFFPSVDSGGEFLFAPPSVRCRPNYSSNTKLQVPSEPSESIVQALATDLTITQTSDASSDICTSEEVFITRDVSTDQDNLLHVHVNPNNVLPGAEVGDYQGMLAWEQYRMDYQGAANSDDIIRRLHFLMQVPHRLV